MLANLFASCGSRMVTVAKWRDGAIAEEYIWI
jgi:hypothetical protein